MNDHYAKPINPTEKYPYYKSTLQIKIKYQHGGVMVKNNIFLVVMYFGE